MVKNSKLTQPTAGKAGSPTASVTETVNDFRIEVPSYDTALLVGIPPQLVFRSGKPFFQMDRYPELSADQTKEIAEHWSAIKTQRKSGTSYHPWLASMRNIAEAWMIGKCMEVCVSHGMPVGLLLDIGGSGERHFTMKRPYVHSCNPDYTKAKHNACKRKMIDCIKTCFPYTIKDTVLRSPVMTFSVHSIYYLTDEELLLAINCSPSKQHWAVVHHYDFGVPENTVQFHAQGEMKWWKVKGSLVCQAKGNANQYIHPDWSWVSSGSQKVFQTANGFETVHSEIMNRFGDQVIVRLTSEETKECPTPPPHMAVPTMDDSKIDTETINGTAYHKTLVDEASAWLLSVDRNSAQARKVFAAQFPNVFDLKYPGIKFPTTDKPKALMDLFNNVRPERVLFEQWARPDHQDDIKEIERLKNGGLVKMSILKSAASGALVSGVTALLLRRSNPLVRVGGTILSGLFGGLAHFAYSAYKAGYTQFRHLRYLKANTTLSLIALLYKVWKWIKGYFFQQRKWVSVYKTYDTCVPAPLKEPHPKAKISKPLPQECEPKKVQQVATFFMPCTIPQRPRSCYHSNATAVYNRCTINYNIEEKWSLDLVPQWFHDQLTSLRDLMRKLGIDEWYDRMPKAKQDKYRRDVHDFYFHLRKMRPLNARDGFMKDEFSLNKEEISARMIQACSSVYNEIVGPWMVALSTASATIFNEFNQHLFYATKTSGEITGMWVNSRVGRGLFAKNDISRWDAHMDQSARIIELWLCKQAGFPESVLGVMKTIVDGTLRLRGGWKVEYKNGRYSGEPQTSVLNTYLLSFITFEICRRLGVKVELMVLGDDTVCFFPGLTVLPFGFQSRAIALFSTFGLSAKFECCPPEELEFCSSLFYPNGGELVMSWKLGRAASKMQWDKDNLPYDELRTWSAEVAVGSRNNASTVPILKELFENVVEQYGKKKPRMLGWEEKIQVENFRPYDHSTVEFLANRYGVCPSMILEEASRVRKAKFPLLLEGPFWDRVSLRDNGGKLWQHDQNLWQQMFQHASLWGVVEPFLRHLALTFFHNMGFFNLCIFSPLMEEAAKRKWRILSVIIGVIEGLIHSIAAQHVLPDVSARVIFVSIMVLKQILLHYLLSLPSYPKGVVLHAIWNFVCMILEYRSAIIAPAALVTLIVKPQMPKKRVKKLTTVRTVVTKSKKTRKNRQRVRRPNKQNRNLFALAQINPFLAEIDGLRIPDSFSYPTGTVVLRAAGNIVNNNVFVTGAWTAFNPFINAFNLQPNSQSAAGVAVWTAPVATNLPQSNAMNTAFSSFRPVAGGIRLTTEQSLTTAQGHVWVAHVPLDYDADQYGIAYFPTTEAGIAALPLAEKYPSAELAANPLIIPFRRVDGSSYRYRDCQWPATSSPYAETNSGWCAIIIMAVGQAGGSLAATFNYEFVMHVEALHRGSTGTLVTPDVCVCPPEPLALIEAETVGMMQPVSHVEMKEETNDVDAWFDRVEKIATRGSRLVGGAVSAYAAYSKMVAPRGGRPSGYISYY